MGYLRKNSFMIYEDKNAPTEVKTLNPQEIAAIEAEHQAGKKVRIDELLREKLMPGTAEKLKAASAASNPGVRRMDRFWDRETREKVVAQWEAEAKAAQKAEEELICKTADEFTQKLATPQAEQLRGIVQVVQDLGVDEKKLNEYLRTTYRTTDEQHLRDFARGVFEIENSKAKFPDLTYRPSFALGSSVRFQPDSDYFWLPGDVPSVVWKEGKQVSRDETEMHAARGLALWVKVGSGGWEENGNWGGHLQVTSGGSRKGKWLDSKNGWMIPQEGKADGTTFYDKGNYYEIWQGTRENGRPLIVEGKLLRFVEGAVPGRFNIQNSTWD